MALLQTLQDVDEAVGSSRVNVGRQFESVLHLLEHSRYMRAAPRLLKGFLQNTHLPNCNNYRVYIIHCISRPAQQDRIDEICHICKAE